MLSGEYQVMRKVEMIYNQGRLHRKKSLKKEANPLFEHTQLQVCLVLRLIRIFVYINSTCVMYDCII